MPDADIYPYQDLDTTRNEIRIIKFKEPDSRYPHLVNCTLKHVSLDDLLPDYRDFLKEYGYFQAYKLHPAWLDWPQTRRERDGPESQSSAPPLIAAWRLTADMNYPQDLRTTMEIDTANLGSMPYPPPKLEWRYPEDSSGSCESEPVATEPNQLPILPRFSWGDYEALSYCWESDVRDKDMLLDGYPIKIPTNLEAMLQHVKNLPEAKTGMGFWVDGLCIDQDKISEKNHQVKLMKRIYAEAYGVIAWLGSGDAESDKAMDFIVQLSDIHSEVEYERLSEEDISRWLNLSENKRLPWRHVLSLLSRNYFTRMWIIQELALNLSMTMFMCGTRQVPRSVLGAATELVMSYSSKIMSISNSSSRSSSTNSADGAPSDEEPLRRSSTASVDDSAQTKAIYPDCWEVAFNISRLLSIRNDHGYLNITLDLSRKANVKDPRDKVYGLLGLLSKSLAADIIPEYSETNAKEAVYHNFAQVLLQASSYLDDVLSWCTFDGASSQPSWVPNWNQTFPRYHVRWFRTHTHQLMARPVWDLSKDTLRLHCSGIVLDEIVNISALSSTYLPYRGFLKPQPDPKNIVKTFGRYKNLPQLQAALFRTLMHKHGSSEPMAPLTEVYWVNWEELQRPDPWDHRMEDFWTFGMRALQDDIWEDFDRFRQTNAHFSMFGHGFKDMFPYMRQYRVKAHSRYKYPGAEVDRWEHTPYEMTKAHEGNMKLTNISLRGRRLVTTQAGTLGLVPDAAQITDKVASLRGCRYPVILRPCAGGYKYIGECYIDGLEDEATVPARYEVREDNIVIC